MKERPPARLTAGVGRGGEGSLPLGSAPFSFYAGFCWAMSFLAPDCSVKVQRPTTVPEPSRNISNKNIKREEPSRRMNAPAAAGDREPQDRRADHAVGKRASGGMVRFYMPYFFLNSSLLVSPHAIIESRMGSRDRPSFVMEYSERGGSSG